MKQPFIINNIFRKNGEVVKISITDEGEVIDLDVTKIKNSTRTFIKYKQYIIKFDVKDKFGNKSDLFNQCELEYKLWCKIESEDKRYFAEIVYYDSEERFLIQRIVRFKREKVNLLSVALIQDLCFKYGLTDVVANKYKGKIHRSNWCVSKSGPVIYDYAI